MNQAWSWILTGIGATGLFVAGRGLWIGWAIGLCGQVPWMIYGATTDQYGFIASAFIYGTVQASNLLHGLKHH